MANNHRKDHEATPAPPAASPPAAAAPAAAARVETGTTEAVHHAPAPQRAKPTQAAAAPAATGPSVASTTPAEDERVEYRPNRKEHLALAGPVALSNWVGRVGNKFVRVYRGAQASSLPEPVIAAMAESGVKIGIITFEELGLRQPPATTLLRR